MPFCSELYNDEKILKLHAFVMIDIIIDKQLFCVRTVLVFVPIKGLFGSEGLI